MEAKTILITGGLGFIGGHFVHQYRQYYPGIKIVVVDKNTYAADRSRIAPFEGQENFVFIEADIAVAEKTHSLFQQYKPATVINFAAESHVDNSISDPASFLATNVTGTFNLLEAARQLWLEKPHGHNFYRSILRKAMAGESLSVVNDQVGSPTTTEQLALFLIQIVKKAPPYGLYHCAGEEALSWYAFAKKILQEHQLDVPLVATITPSGGIKRPRFSALATEKSTE